VRRGLLLVWLLLGALVVGIVALEVADRLGAGRDERAGDPRMLLPMPVDQLGAIEIVSAGRLHRFERGASGRWFYHGVHAAATPDHTHEDDPAQAERIERAFAAFGRTRIERDFALDREGAAYGLTAPVMVVLVYGPGQRQPLQQYAVGHVAPDTVSRYVHIVGRPVVVTIAGYQIDNLVELVRAVEAPSPPEPRPAGRP
jgi:hypothetical protein